MSSLTRQVRQSAHQAWVSLSEGWNELRSRASGALTPQPVDVERATASYRDGVLRVELPRPTQRRWQRVVVHRE